MITTIKDPGQTTVGTILDRIEAAVKEGGAVAVAETCLPVLAREAGCCPDGDGNFVFGAPAASAMRCGWVERGLSVLLLAVLSPVFAVVAGLVLLFEGRPVIFRQERYGCDGVPFTVFKFRTMVRRSESLHGRLQQKLGQEGHLFKLARDPRVTRLGGFLRRSFLDELPQLLNVAKGEMRFIGPRPLPASDQGHYTRPCHALRLKGMPGITGLWQVAGRNERTFDEMCLLDCYYLCHRSLAFDLHLIMRTVRVMFKEVCLKREPQCGGEQPSDVAGAGRGGQHRDGNP